jgi:hypothetical protein
MEKTTKIHFKAVLFGILAWLIPFLLSFFFYSRDGGLLIDIFFFKTIMIVVGSIVAAFLLVLYFKKIEKNYFKEGVYVGIVWFFLNVVLDLIILIPMSGMFLDAYFTQIGLRYLVMPVMTIMIGAVLDNKK